MYMILVQTEVMNSMKRMVVKIFDMLAKPPGRSLRFSGKYCWGSGLWLS